MFGVGVKLSTIEDHDDVSYVEAAEDALRSICEITGHDFIAATGVFVDEEALS
jgi:hypothetical protein